LLVLCSPAQEQSFDTRGCSNRPFVVSSKLVSEVHPETEGEL
jgi:hypothetical protein